MKGGNTLRRRTLLLKGPVIGGEARPRVTKKAIEVTVSVIEQCAAACSSRPREPSHGIKARGAYRLTGVMNGGDFLYGAKR